MEELDWTKFTRRVYIKKDLPSVYTKISSRKGIEEWFLKEAKFYTDGIEKDIDTPLSIGDSYLFSWYGTDFTSEGKILSIQENESFGFTFLGCRVDITLRNEEDEVLVELTQSEIATDDQSKMHYYVECTRGWTTYLLNLKSILEGGIDLRNKNPNFVRVINV